MAPPPRIAIFGAGSIGCFVGGAWIAAGLPVTLIGRERLSQEVAEHGIAVSDQDGWSAKVPPEKVVYETNPAAMAEAGIIALCVKSIATDAAAADIAAHAPAGATMISFQNGVSNGARLRELLPGLSVAQGMVPYNVIHLGPGHWHRATWGELTAGRNPATEALSAAIGDRPGRLLLADDMTPIAWGKLLLNLNNAVNALSGTTILEELKQRPFRKVMAAAIAETVELLDAAGIEPAKIGKIAPRRLAKVIGSPDFLFRNLFLRMQKVDPNARSSMSDDFEVGRPTEIDYLNGEVVRLARALGREAPINAAISRLVREAEAGGRKQWSGRDLHEHVLMGR